QRLSLINGDDVGARHHDVLDTQAAEFEKPQHHDPLLGAERVVGLGFSLQRVLKRIAQSLSARQPKSRLEARKPAMTSVSGMLAASRWVDVDAHFRSLAHASLGNGAAYGSGTPIRRRISTSRASITRACASVSWS